jgi:hypothetical protein
MTDAGDEQRAEWAAFEHAALLRGICPHSGGRLIRRRFDDGPPDPAGAVLSCDMCDCFGYPAVD